MTGPSEYAQAIWLTSPNNDLVSVSVFRIRKFNIASSMDSEGVPPQRMLSGGLQTALHPGRTVIYPCWVWFCFLHNETGNERRDRKSLQCWYCRAGYCLPSSLSEECPSLFHDTSNRRHLQMWGSLTLWIQVLVIYGPPWFTIIFGSNDHCATPISGHAYRF